MPEDTPPHEVLTHLNLLDKGRPTHAAILLFAKHPQRFLIASERAELSATISVMRMPGTSSSSLSMNAPKWLEEIISLFFPIVTVPIMGSGSITMLVLPEISMDEGSMLP